MNHAQFLYAVELLELDVTSLSASLLAVRFHPYHALLIWVPHALNAAGA